ncbi:tyrosine-type recombinase/integrase [Halobacterium sp. R2-5]|uniref:tyrosine-type recombinase/integrase n=1 Tax=Halobacterium sp. R2-5 TaxID=2715751 RepID=UPI001AAF67A8|nr:tyrosine-type recombinase/integrase [Halobacterium sp. R2-5]
MARRYRALEDCRTEIRDYADDLDAGTDDDSDHKRDTSSTGRYEQDIRWFDEWLDNPVSKPNLGKHTPGDEAGEEEQTRPAIESPLDLTIADANRLGRAISHEFNGTTPRYRWDRIHAMYEYFVTMTLIDSNPMEKWDGKKEEKWGMTKGTAQSDKLGEDESYAVSQDDVRLMEENVGRHRVRDQCIIRMMWQTGIRRGEQSGLLTTDIDRDGRVIHIRAENAKNGEERYVGYQKSLDGLLDLWLDGGHRDEMLGIVDDEAAPHDYVFVGERGAQLSGSRINDIVIEAADRAGINRKMYGDANAPIDPETKKPKPNRWKITAHNVRHGYGSYMINEAPGADGQARLWEVSQQMGHSSVQITEDIYVENDPKAGLDYALEAGPE